ncbi:18552_t:CDS:2 [Rhizophagus irregularis]|nr:18552_t:CDS:2 [Rhizophagus irregularis]
MSYNNKCNKRIRSGSPDNYEEEYIALILDDSSNICEKENEKNIEAEQINKRILVNIDNSEDSEEEMEIKLHVGQSFQTWLDAEKFLNQYSLKEGFSIRRKRTEKLVENGIEIIRKITWECCCAGKYQAKKVINPENQRNKKSKCTDCQWHVNGNLPKSSSNISFTTVINEHNHQMIPSPSATIAKHRKLDEDIIEFINFYVLHGTTDFFQCRNTLSPAIFESRWQNLKEKYSSVSGANSTQRVESLNKKVHDSVNSCSSLLTLVKEIQQLLDDEANYIRIQEYKDEIPSIGLENVAQRYFTSIEKIVSDYLMAPMIIPTHTEDNYNEGVREDHYEIAKILLGDISATITKSEIVEIWRIVVSCGLKNQYVVLLSDGSHRCTCNLLITHGYPCRHFYKILRTSPNAKWHVGLISSRWYKDDKIASNSITQQAPISICSSEDNATNNITNFNLGHITKIRGSELYTPILQELNNNRIKYGRAHGMLKKAINLALATNSYEELIGMCQDFLVRKQDTLDQNRVKETLDNEELDVVNSIITVRKGRPPGRVKSAVEIQDKESRRHCLKSIDLNVQKGGNKTQLGNSRDNRKTC